MKQWFSDIGCAAGVVHPHATRLTLEREDSPGGGSAAVEDEEDAGQHIVDEALLEDGEDPDDQPTGRRAKQQKAYDELKSKHDRLAADNEKKDRLLQDLTQRMEAIERGKETRDEVNDRTNARLERAKKLAREVMDEVKKLPADDPDRGIKIYERLFERTLENQERLADEISRERATEVVQQSRYREEREAEIKRETIAALEEAGLSEDEFDLVEAIAMHKGKHDPGWFKRTHPDEQLPELVNILKKRLVRTKRDSQEHRDEKRNHREAMDGVIDTSRSTVRGRRTDDDDEDDDRQQGPGSILADLARLKKTQRLATDVMLKHRER